MRFVVDVWGGENSNEHVARSLQPSMEAAMDVVILELMRGFLVNIRVLRLEEEAAWGEDESFETRLIH